MKYRMYVDEVGNSNLATSQDSNHPPRSAGRLGGEIGYPKKTAPRAREGDCLPPPENWITVMIGGLRRNVK